ncbi:MAG TPA: sulfite exporter TauE/SafE family protein [Methylophilaceae bacterium]|nr:sulfite exporter TauE/SafE family protein [Methylophilaceae bacterium]
MTIALLLAVFLGALVSGWHCALMCSGIAVAIENPVRVVSRKRLMLEQLVMHLGRISTYTLLGGLAGLIGARLWQQNWLPIQRLMFALAACLLLFQAYLLSRGSNLKQARWEVWLSARTGKLWQKLSRKVLEGGRAVSLTNSWHGRLVAGAVWGLVPCGLIYSVLPLALLSGSGWAGAALMLAFGLGTLPNLLLISGFSARLAGMGHRLWARYAAASLMAATGGYGLYLAATLSNAMLRAGFCFS